MSDFSTTLGDASTLLQAYLEELQSSLISGSAPPVFPTQIADQVASLSNSLSQFSGYQATYSEAKMNRSVELLRGMSRALAVSNMGREDFYSNAISAAF